MIEGVDEVSFALPCVFEEGFDHGGEGAVFGVSAGV